MCAGALAQKKGAWRGWPALSTPRRLSAPASNFLAHLSSWRVIHTSERVLAERADEVPVVPADCAFLPRTEWRGDRKLGAQ